MSCERAQRYRQDDQTGPGRHLSSVSVRKRNEFGCVAGNDIETTGLPVGLGGFDAVLARGDEIPPDVPWPIHRRSADDNEMGVAGSLDRDQVARLEHEEPLGTVT